MKTLKEGMELGKGKSKGVPSRRQKIQVEKDEVRKCNV